MKKWIEEDWEFEIGVTKGSAQECRLGFEQGDRFFCHYECPTGFCPKTMPVLYTLCEIVRCGGNYKLKGSKSNYEIDFSCADQSVEFRLTAKYIGTLKETEGLRLRAYRPEDCSSIIKWIKDERTHAFWCANLLPYPLDEASFERARAEMEQKQGKRSFTVTTEDGNLAGYFFMNTDAGDNSAFLGFIIVNDELRGKGYGIKMLRLIKEYAFSVVGVEKIRLRVFDVNEAAVHCYKKAGFIAIEHEPEAFLFHSEKWGRYVMEAYR